MSTHNHYTPTHERRAVVRDPHARAMFWRGYLLFLVVIIAGSVAL
jgi:hypothetical protein